MILENARLLFESVFESKSFQGEGDAKFSATFGMAPDSVTWKRVLKHVDTIATAKWGKHAQEILDELKAKDRVCFGDKPKRNAETREVYAGFDGMCWVSASNTVRPAVVDTDGVTPLVKADGRPYRGCYVYADVDIYAMDHKKYGRRIVASLIGVQYFKKGEAFGQRAGSADAFAPLSVEDEGDDDGLGS